jgi:hypothetical protein
MKAARKANSQHRSVWATSLGPGDLEAVPVAPAGGSVSGALDWQWSVGKLSVVQAATVASARGEVFQKYGDGRRGTEKTVTMCWNIVHFTYS